jgi:hypothetical protein
MVRKIYLSGKITGLPIEKAQENFARAESEVIKLGWSIENIMNPMKLPHLHDKSWEEYMREDLECLRSCHAIYMQKNWHGSKGSNLEFDEARKLKLEIIFEQ